MLSIALVRSLTMAMYGRGVVWICNLTLISSVTGQRLAVEAVHRNSTGLVVKLEREYVFDEGRDSLFVTVYSDGARAQRRSYEHHGDTLVERNDCYELDLFPRWCLTIKDAEELTVGRGPDSTYYGWYYMFDTVVAFDTVIAADSDQHFEAFIDRLKNHVVEAVHLGELELDLTDLRLLETWTWRTLGEELIDLRISEGRGGVTGHQVFTCTDTSLVGSYFGSGDTTPPVIDSLSWNCERTRCVSIAFRDGHDRYEHTTLFLGDRTLRVSGKDTTETRWLYDRKPWTTRLRECLIQEGPSCYSDIMQNREALPAEKRGSDGLVERYEYVVGDGQRIERIQRFRSEKPAGLVEYRYY